MNRLRFAVATSALVVAVSLVIHAQGTGPQSQSVEIQLQLGNMFFGEGRYQESLEAYRNAVESASPDQMRQARGGVILSSLRVAEFESARVEAEKLIQESPRAPGFACVVRRCALGVGPVRRGRSEVSAGAGHHARDGSRPARPGALARGAGPTRSGDGQGAGRPASVPPRPRNSPHRRDHLRDDAQVPRRRPPRTPTTSTCCRTKTAATRPTGRAPRFGSCARSASACRSRPSPAPRTRSSWSRSSW